MTKRYLRANASDSLQTCTVGSIVRPYSGWAGRRSGVELTVIAGWNGIRAELLKNGDPGSIGKCGGDLRKA